MVKLSRRLNITSIKCGATKITIKGHVSWPFAKHTRDVVLRQQTSCASTSITGHDKPDRNGNVTYVVPIPAGADAVVFRLTTRVRKTTGSEHEFKTYSLAQGINLFAS